MKWLRFAVLSAFTFGILACLSACAVSSKSNDPLAVSSTDSSKTQASPSLESVIPGSKWQVTSVSSHNEVTNVAAPLKATVVFSRTGKISGSDSFNAFNGDYDLNELGFTTSHTGATAEGSTGLSWVQAAIIDAVDHVLVSSANQKSTGRAVNAEIKGKFLVLSVEGYKVTLVRQ